MRAGPSATCETRQRALAEFLRCARAVEPSAWDRARDAEAWSPAQIAEHVRLAYVVVGAPLTGGTGLRVRTPWWLRPFLRWRFLGGILDSARFPRSRAPRELRPGPGPFDREETLRAIESAAAELERNAVTRWNDARAAVTHHVFGNLDAADGLRLATAHTVHHTRQLRTIAEL
jgi:Protein of unknown function (DUF1569)